MMKTFRGSSVWDGSEKGQGESGILTQILGCINLGAISAYIC